MCDHQAKDLRPTISHIFFSSENTLHHSVLKYWWLFKNLLCVIKGSIILDNAEMVTTN